MWIFGILAGGFGGSKFSSNFSSYSGNSTDWQKTFSNIDQSVFTNFWVNWGGVILGVIAALLVLGFICFILSIISQGALISSSAKLSKNEKANFKIGFWDGFHQFWRVLGVLIVYGLMVTGSLIVLLGPVIVSVLAKAYIFAIIWGILLFFVDLAFWILVALISPYSLRMVVLEKIGIFRSVREGLHFFRDHWKEVVVMYLLLIVVGIAFGIVLLLAILIVGGILLAIGFGTWLASASLAIGYGILAGLVFVIAIMLFSGAYNSFTSTVLTLTFLELKK